MICLSISITIISRVAKLRPRRRAREETANKQSDSFANLQLVWPQLRRDAKTEGENELSHADRSVDFNFLMDKAVFS